MKIPSFTALSATSAKLTNSFFCVLLGVFLTFVSPLQAAHTDEEQAEANEIEEKFEPGRMILEHVSDAHDWHLWGHTAIPLPIIIYSPEQGLKVFSSSHFEHGHKAYEGVVLHEGHLVWEDETCTDGLYDLSITKNVMAMLLASAFLLFMMIKTSSTYRKRAGKAPRGFLNLLEPLILFLRDDVAKPSIGKKSRSLHAHAVDCVLFHFCQ